MKITLSKALEAGPTTVTFTKVDGTKRVMRATTRKDLIKYTYRTKEGAATPAAEGVLRVWDLDKNEWRSIRADSVKSFA